MIKSKGLGESFPKMALRMKSNRELPCDMSDLLYRLGEAGKIFTEVFEFKEKMMCDIYLSLISEEEDKMQENTARRFRAVFGGCGVALCLLTLSRVTSLAQKLGMVAGTAACIVFTLANVIPPVKEEICEDTEEELGKEFVTIVKGHKDILEEIEKVSQELDKSLLMLMQTVAQDRTGLLEELEQLQLQTAELARRSRAALDTLTRLTQKPEEDVESVSHLCDKTLVAFAKTRDMVKDFQDM